MPTLKPSDLWLWLATNEEQLLLHDGLVRLADHIAVPSGVTEVSDDDFGLPVMDGKNTEDLTEIILKECSTRSTTYASLMEYRLNALRGFWEAVRMNEKEQALATMKESSSSSRSSSGGAAGFASRVSLVLIFPIMKSLSRFDPTLSSEAASVLLECLRVYEPLSLSNEPLDCVYGLESLLHSWLASARESEGVGVTQVQNAASALVALSVAVGTGSLLLRTVHMLQSLRSSYSDLRLLVPGVLCKLLREHVTNEDSAALSADAHLCCWGYADTMGQGGREGEGHRSIAFDGKFVYVTSSSLKCLLKLGTGKHGTIRGYVYCRQELPAGWVVWVDGHLLHRTQKTPEEKETDIFCSELDTNTLKPCGSLPLSCVFPEPPQTLYLMSDGLYVYWMYSLRAQDSITNPVTGEKIKQFPIYIHQLQVKSTSSPDSLILHPVRDPVLLQRGSLDRDKNSDVAKALALVRGNPSYASTAFASMFGVSKDDTSGATSVGMTMRVLQSCSAYTTGTSLVLVVPPNTSGGGRGLFGPSSGHASKALCVSVCFSIQSGSTLSQSELMPSPNLHCALAKGASMNSMAVCYDYHNHCVWTSNDDWIDTWDCTGKVRLAVHHLATRLGKTSASELIPELDKSQKTVEVSEAISLLLRHIAIESCRLVPSSEMRSVVPHHLSLVFLDQCCDLLTAAMSERDWENCQAISVTLLAVLPAFLKKGNHKEEGLAPHRERVRCLVWELLNRDDCPESLHTETRRLISFNAENLFLNHKDCDHFIQTLLEAGSDQPRMAALRERILVQTAHNLELATSLSPALLSLCPLLQSSVMNDSLEAVGKCLHTPLNQLATLNPVFSGSLQCAAALMNVTLRVLSHAAEEEGEKGKREGRREGEGEETRDDGGVGVSLQAAQETLLKLCSSFDLFKACQTTLEALCSGLENQLACTEAEREKEEGEGGGSERQHPWVLGVERTLKCTVLGGLLLPLLVVVGDQRVCTLQMANMLQKSLHPLVQLVAQSSFTGRYMAPRTASRQEAEMWGRAAPLTSDTLDTPQQLCGLLYGSLGKLSSIKVPAPWATGRTVETIHPVRDNYKFKETVSFPGARNLYLKFDSRCSSQYDYDKVTVYAGDSPGAPKVAEYGGNTHGFGSRSVWGKGWPKDLVKVEGDVVTITFEMKSGREHSTPDRAMWGVACTVRPQESPEESSHNLPFTIDIYLSLASVCCSLIGSLYEGPVRTSEEGKCRHLMDSELLQQCEWHVSEGALDSLPLDSEQTTISCPPPHDPLPPVIIERLRALAKKPRPLLRPSTSDLLQPDLLEDVIVSVCLKQHGLESALQLLGESSSSHSSGCGSEEAEREAEEHCSLLDAVFTRINGLERRLQALVELEKNWWTDVEDIVRGTMNPSEAFFFNLLQHETSLQNFELLCCLKNIDTTQGDIFTTTKQLQDFMELDVEKRRNASPSDGLLDSTPVTRQLVAGVMERARLLLSVTIAKGHPPLLSYSSTHEQKAPDESGEITSPILAYTRSFSAPPITMEYAVRRQRSGVALSRSKQALLEISSCPDKSNLLDQIFMFIGSKPEEAVSPDCFLAAASQQWRRGVCRVRALGYLHQLLSSEHVTMMAVDHLLVSVGSVIQRGPRVSDIACGGMAQPVREAFANVMQAVVVLASKQPAKCINTIAMLCIVPYTRLEESCLVHSGLVKLLDRLCSQVSTVQPLEVSREEDEAEHRVTSLAWAAFQVLADRCVSWESQEASVVSSGLAQQVSMLLTNHLSRAMDSLVVSETGASEGLQDALSLLLGLARSRMGRAILSQPACVSKLLLLLTDQRPSPKLVLIALQLCRIALPLMTVAECSQVVVPQHPSLPAPSEGVGLAADIVRLLLAKLAEYIVPDATEVTPKHTDAGTLSPMDEDPHTLPAVLDNEADESGQASVYVHKRSNESSAEILQPLISQDPRQFRLSGHRMQEVMHIDRALTEQGKAEVFTDSYRSCQRRALRWASMGFVVSIGSPSGGTGEPSGTTVDKKKAKAEAAAKKKNLELLKTDPPRPFLSGQVAYSLASEVIGLLHGLVTTPRAAQVWSTAIREALLKSLHSIPQLAPRLVSFTEETHKHVASGTPPPSPGELLQASCIANATFAALGGFKESIRPGMKVKVVGEGLEESCGVIQSMAERRGIASVQFMDDEFCFGPNKTLDVPISRLLPPQKEMLPLKQLQVGPELCSAICAILETTPPSINHAHSSSDANNASLGLCRLCAEMRSRACMALAFHVKQAEFLKLFMTTGCLENLRAQLTNNPGLRLSVMESHCLSLRMLYRDCARPAAPRIEKPRSEPKVITLDVTREWPPVASCAFSHNLTSLSYQGPSAAALSTATGSGEGSVEVVAQPKGVMVFASIPIPGYSPSFYWEVELGHMGDNSSDTAHVAMGYSPAPEKLADGQSWSYPVDSVFIRSSGRGCQVKGENLMEWNTFRLASPLKNGDVVGCGWVREEEGLRGSVYFTLNGHRTDSGFGDVPPEMTPFLHIQKKGVHVRVNFGDRPFAYGEGHAHRNAADVQKGDSAEELVALFEVLPFALGMSDSEEDVTGGEGEGEKGGGGVVVELSQTGPPTKKMKTPIATVGYDAEVSPTYQLGSCYDNMLECGPLVRPGGSGQEEQSEEEGTSTPQEEDLHALLVKAWETKVFPVIQRRFRNDQERKSGLEQIKGALQLGMEGIAQETVEFLYEENGGIPKDLHLPTMDDVKAELGKFTISKVRKSMAVVVQKDLPYARCGVRSMQKTQGLTGIVLDIDEHNELVQVECYLQSEGALVRFWFPVVYLEKPPPGYRKSPTLRGADAANILVHRELLKCEASLCSIYCRRALLSLHLPASPAIEPALDHLQLVAVDCLSEPLMEGCTTSSCPDIAPSPSACLRMLGSSPLTLFYSDPSPLLHELSVLLHTLSQEVEGLAARLCKVLHSSPNEFGSLEVKVTETKEAVDVGHTDAAFLIVSCVDEKGASPPPSSTFKYPWTRVLCYKGGLGKSGKQQLQEVARYPSEVANQYCGPTYPSLVLPFSRVHLKTGGCGVRPLKKIHLLSVPPDLPLSLAFIHALCMHSISALKESPLSEATHNCSRSLSACLESLSKLITRLEMPQVLKERTLHLFSEVLWTLCSITPDGLTPASLSTDFMQGLRLEVLQLYELEVGKFSKAKQKTGFPPPGSISDGGQGKFSTYFQALLECFLASNVYRQKFHGIDSDVSVSPSSSGSQVNSSPSSEPVKKSSVRRFRIRRGAAKKDTVDNDPRKKEEWLGVVQNASQVLTSLVTHPRDSASPDTTLPATHSEASLISSLPVHPNDRLIVVTGIRGDLPVEEARASIRRVCRSYGGLFNDQLYMPARDCPRVQTREKITTDGGQGVGGGGNEHAQEEREGGEVGERREGGEEGREGGNQLSDSVVTQEQESQETLQVSSQLTPVTSDTSASAHEQSGQEASLPEKTPLTRQLVGHAVLELCCSSHISVVCDSLLKLQCLRSEGTDLAVMAVSDALVCSEEETQNRVLEEYLQHKLIEGGTLTAPAEQALRCVFDSSLAGAKETDDEKSTEVVGGDLLLFFAGFGGKKGPGKDVADAIWKEILSGGGGGGGGGGGEGGREGGGERSQVSVEDFLRWCSRQAVGSTTQVWQGLFACGYDLHFTRCGYVPDATPTHPTTTSQDQALVQYVDSLCRHLGVTSASLQPWDISPSEASLSSRLLAPLQDVSLSDLRMRFLQLKYINHQLSLLLPIIDLRTSHPLSLGVRLSRLAPLLFYDVKITFLHAVLNASTRRSLDQAPPEIKMDPLESLTGVSAVVLETQFCKAAQQMLGVPSPQLCVSLASGGDPTYAFNVKLSGEEVHGTSGSFRHFVWQVVRELQSSVLPVLIPCPSGATGINTGKYILAPGDMSYSEEKLLQFFGQLVGVAIRADVPIALDLLPCFWKSLKGEPLSLEDLKEADCITYHLTEKMLSCSSVEEFDELLTGLTHDHRRGEEGEGGVAGGGASSYTQGLHFVYHTMTGQEKELCPGGSQKELTFANRVEFVTAVRELRLRELSCDHRMISVRCGLASIIPLQLLNIFTPLDLDLRVCGLPDISLDYLRRHTKYHVGLEETDKHVQFFWNALETLSQEELRKFIKFACNQERIPFGHPCRDGAKDSSMNVPPYPMKIAPPDGSGPPDSRYIRAETCMFMLKLPQYSTQEVMTSRLRYAIHCTEDPLSG